VDVIVLVTSKSEEKDKEEKAEKKKTSDTTQKGEKGKTKKDVNKMASKLGKQIDAVDARATSSKGMAPEAKAALKAELQSLRQDLADCVRTDIVQFKSIDYLRDRTMDTIRSESVIYTSLQLLIARLNEIERRIGGPPPSRMRVKTGHSAWGGGLFSRFNETRGRETLPLTSPESDSDDDTVRDRV